MGYSRKKTNRGGGGGGGGLKTYFFENPPWNFSFFTLPLEIPYKAKLHPWKFHKIVLDPLKILRPKPRPLKIPHYVFFFTLENSTLFLIGTVALLQPLHRVRVRIKAGVELRFFMMNHQYSHKRGWVGEDESAIAPFN